MAYQWLLYLYVHIVMLHTGHKGVWLLVDTSCPYTCLAQAQGSQVDEQGDFQAQD